MKDTLWEKIKRSFRRGDNKFLYGPICGKEGWVGGDDRIIFTDRPDPLNMMRDKRIAEMRRQIQEDVK